MTEYLELTDEIDDVADRTTKSAEQLMDATPQQANAAIDGATEKIQALKDSASPAVDRLTAVYEGAVARTRESPVASVLIAAAAGAGLMAIGTLLRSAARR